MEWWLLIVEDIENTRQQLAMLLGEAIPGIHIEQAGSVREALDLIERICASGKSYHVAILDFKLPMTPSDNPEIDESVCLRVRDSMPGALIVHFTGYVGDPAIDRHMAAVHGLEMAKHMAEMHPHDRPDQARCWLIDKGKQGWPEQLVAHVENFLDGTRRVLARERVRDSLDRLFGSAGSASSRGVYKTADLGRSVTHELESLCHDIGRFWHDLDGDLQARVTQHLTVVPDGQGVKVRLIREV